MPVGFAIRPDSLLRLAEVNKKAYSWYVQSSEFRRWLARQGVTFGTQAGSDLKLFYMGRQSVLPIRPKDLGKGLVETINRQLA